MVEAPTAQPATKEAPIEPGMLVITETTRSFVPDHIAVAIAWAVFHVDKEIKLEKDTDMLKSLV
jgi:hypothetical protein